MIMVRGLPFVASRYLNLWRREEMACRNYRADFLVEKMVRAGEFIGVEICGVDFVRGWVEWDGDGEIECRGGKRDGEKTGG